MNRWELTKDIEDTYLDGIKQFIGEVETTPEDAEFPSLDLTGTRLNPFILVLMLEKLGYGQHDFTQNGWQLDFWYTLTKPGFKTLRVAGTGIIFTLTLSVD